jgi:nucleoside-diphosphate-sugar epimerase
VGDTLKLIGEIMGGDVEFLTDEKRLRPGKSEVFRLWGGNAKLVELTGFKPEHSIEDGLRKTVTWFLDPDNLKHYKAGIYNV